MGYYTQHSLSITPENKVVDIDDYKKEISVLSGYDCCFSYPIKWYHHDENMRAYSKIYPDLLFILKGEGEEAGDLWVEYYKNGKMQRTKAVIVYDEFDENKLV